MPNCLPYINLIPETEEELWNKKYLGKWFAISELPEESEESEELMLFIQFYKNRIINEYCGTIHSAKGFRKYQLENDYTHFMYLPKLTII